MKTLKAFMVVLFTTFTGWVFILGVITTIIFINTTFLTEQASIQNAVVRIALAFAVGWSYGKVITNVGYYLDRGNNERKEK